MCQCTSLPSSLELQMGACISRGSELRSAPTHPRLLQTLVCGRPGPRSSPSRTLPVLNRHRGPCRSSIFWCSAGSSMGTRYSHTSVTSWPRAFCRRWFAHCVCQTTSGRAGWRSRRARDGMDTDGEQRQRKARKRTIPGDTPLGQPGTQRGPSRLQAPRKSRPARFCFASLRSRSDKKKSHLICRRARQLELWRV